MPVGNDVVDLRHSQCLPCAIHPRFDSRVFSSAELSLLATTDQVHRTRWSLWAAKESAFKASCQLDRQVRFIPREFTVQLEGDRAQVVHHSGPFHVWFDHSDSWVHAVASVTDQKPEIRIEGDAFSHVEDRERDASDRARLLVRSALAVASNLTPAAIRILAEDRIPRAQYASDILPFDLSMSHDGRFVACAWQKTGTDS